MSKPFLEIEGLRTYFYTPYGKVKAVDNLDMTLDMGETLGIVGESGCGKSVLARSILRLIPDPPGKIVAGSIRFEGTNLLDLTESEMQQVRGNAISMIFQEPMTSLNPVYTIGYQLSEVFRKHRNFRRSELKDAIIEMLKIVGIPSPETRLKEYPFQMSGGMRQRVIIAMALACKPRLILADEPTTALDVTIQAQILDLIKDLEQELGTSMILITHDLGVISETVRRVVVMYAGQIVEEATVDELFNNPSHPYTEGLMWSIPTLDSDQNKNTKPLQEIPGIVPDLARLPNGCYFYPRCHKRMDACSKTIPNLVSLENNHQVRCLLYS